MIENFITSVHIKFKQIKTTLMGFCNSYIARVISVSIVHKNNEIRSLIASLYFIHAEKMISLFEVFENEFPAVTAD